MTSNYYTEPRPARKIPTREQIEVAARRQARYEAALQEADPSYSGHNAGIQPEQRQFQAEYELEEDEEYYITRPHSSVRRYQSVPIDTKGGRIKVEEHFHDQPLRAHLKEYQQLSRQRERYTDEVETPVAKVRKQKRSIHPLLYLGVGMIAMLALFVLLLSAATWLQEKQNDLTYGRPRTFQIDVVVGHNDSPSNPSHFIAINLYRHVEVIEMSGQDSTKERTFPITTLYGDGEDLTPVTLSFRDVNGDGKPDMLIHIEQQTLVMINENGSFRPAKPGEVKGLL